MAIDSATPPSARPEEGLQIIHAEIRAFVNDR